MRNTALTLDKIFEEVSLAAKREERKALNIAQKMINLGLPLETNISATEIDSEKVKELFQQ